MTDRQGRTLVSIAEEPVARTMNLVGGFLTTFANVAEFVVAFEPNSDLSF
ncbi:MAG: hypothetical protein AB8G99_06620 [Planctomycetaceae bacterium]